MKKILYLAVGIALLGGCAREDGPAVSLIDVHFQAATVLETTAVFTLRLENNLPEPLHLNGSAHRIYLNGLYIGSGLSDAPLDVPRLSTATNDVTVHLSNLAMATRVKSVIESKGFDYRIVSKFYGRSWFEGLRSVSEGRLELNDFMPSPTNEVPAEAPAPEPR